MNHSLMPKGVEHEQIRQLWGAAVEPRGALGSVRQDETEWVMTHF